MLSRYRCLNVKLQEGKIVSTGLLSRDSFVKLFGFRPNTYNSKLLILTTCMSIPYILTLKRVKTKMPIHYLFLLFCFLYIFHNEEFSNSHCWRNSIRPSGIHFYMFCCSMHILSHLSIMSNCYTWKRFRILDKCWLLYLQTG